jgi:hypothetical protein
MWLRAASPFSLVVKISPSLINWCCISAAIHLNQPHVCFSFIKRSMGFVCYKGAQEFPYASAKIFARCTKGSGAVSRK